MPSTSLKIIMAAAAVLALAACGESRFERGATGAGIGAAGGAVGGALAGGDPATGALLGGAIGGATGAFTDEDDIDLGEPIWE
jgi:hypothetical protein